MIIRDTNSFIKRAPLREHLCDLPRTSGSNLPKLPPNARFYSRWSRNLQKLILASNRHPLTRLIFRSQAAVAFEKRKHSRSTYRWIIHPSSIRYVKGYFFIDIISSIPYAWFYPIRILPPNLDSNSALLILEFLHILKIMRIPTVHQNIQRINTSFEIPQIQQTTIWLIILTILIFHWSSCISYVFPYIVMHIQGKTIEDSNIYYISTKLYDKPDWEVYLVFIHIGVSNLIGSNFIEFESFNILDTIIRYILLLLGKGYMIYLIVIILQFMESSAKPKLKYQRIIHEIKEYIRQKNLPPYLQHKLISYYEYQYQGSFFKENIISDILSDHLNQEILFYNTQRLLDIPIFYNLPRNVFGDLINSLKPVIYLKEDVIYKAGTEGDCMYIISSGTVVLITFSGKEICHLYDGDFFGERSLIYPHQHREESIIALEICELFRLYRRDFKRLLATNLEFCHTLEYIIQERSQRIRKLEEKNPSETT
ncbi:hypothetical protein P5V15_014289 [Pogonomyrmex californicus]